MHSAETNGAAAAADGETLSEGFARFLAGLTAAELPAAAKAVALRDLVDAAGLCLAARNETYVQQVLAGWDSEGTCTALGHDRALDAGGAGGGKGGGDEGEAFDGTLEGGANRGG